MDYVTRQFINLAKHFRKDLRHALAGLNGALNKQTEAIRESHQISNDKQSPAPEVTVLNNLPSSIEIHQNKKDTTDERNYKRVMFLVTTATLGAIVVYADLVNLQYREMIRSTDAATKAVEEARLNRQQSDKAFNATVEQFHLEQRAWVSIKSVQLTKQWGASSFGELTVFLANSGKTPALNVHLANVFFKGFPKWLTSLPSVQMNIAPQSSDDTFYVQVPPGTNTRVDVRFVIEYLDIFQKPGDKPHTTSFCGYYPGSFKQYFFNSSGCAQPN